MKDIEFPPLPHWCEAGSPFAEQLQAYARATESAACAERDARIAELEKDCDRLERYWNEAMATHKNIAELERQLAEARKDAERWRWIWNHAHNVSFTYQVDPITSATVMRLHCGSLADVVDKAIRAAIKEQT